MVAASRNDAMSHFHQRHRRNLDHHHKSYANEGNLKIFEFSRLIDKSMSLGIAINYHFFGIHWDRPHDLFSSQVNSVSSSHFRLSASCTM